jgi:two-component system alkaline phosphatase synthesis response regulator PhoP
MSNLTLGNVVIDRDRFEVWVDDRRVELTFVEFELLWELARNARQVLSRHRLMRSVWHEPATAGNRKISVHVSRLRRKLHGSTWTIETHAKRGYMLTNGQHAIYGEAAPMPAQSF